MRAGDARAKTVAWAGRNEELFTDPRRLQAEGSGSGSGSGEGSGTGTGSGEGSGSGSTSSCAVQVLSVEHTDGVVGKFFHFNMASVDGFDSGDTELVLTVVNSRTQEEVTVALFSNPNGGTAGDAHGRIQPSEEAQAGDWQVGDELLIVDTSYCPGEPRCDANLMLTTKYSSSSTVVVVTTKYCSSTRGACT